MGIREDFISSGNWLFKYRSIIPFFIFIPIILFIYHFPSYFFSNIPNWSYYCISISLFGELIRIITVAYVPVGTSGRNTKKQRAKYLNTTGIYSTVRHPLYLGNFFIWLGILMYFFNIWLFIITSLIYLLYYERIMFAEENYLLERFGNRYKIWSNKTPIIIPSITWYEKSNNSFSIRTIFLREYTGLFGLFVGFTLLEIFKSFCKMGYISISVEWIIFSVIALILYISFRSLKKYTDILKVNK